MEVKLYFAQKENLLCQKCKRAHISYIYSNWHVIYGIRKKVPTSL